MELICKIDLKLAGAGKSAGHMRLGVNLSLLKKLSPCSLGWRFICMVSDLSCATVVFTGFHFPYK